MLISPVFEGKISAKASWVMAVARYCPYYACTYPTDLSRRPWLRCGTSPMRARFSLCAVGVYRPNIMQQTVASCTCSQVQTERHETTSRDDGKATLQINQRPQFGSQEVVQAEVRCVVAIAVVATGTHDGGGGGGRGRGIQHADVPII